MRLALAALWISVVPTCLFAQKTEADLRARLVKKPLYLRGQWSSDRLAFDGTGALKGTSAPVTFTLAGADIESVKLTSKELVLKAQRVGLEFDKDVPKRVGLVLRNVSGGTSPEEMTIRIQMPADADFTAALNAIFVDGIGELVPQLPWYWQSFAQKHLLPAAAPAPKDNARLPAASDSQEQPSAKSKLSRVGGSVSVPRPLTQVDPEFDSAARALRFSGIVLINLIVDAAGKPTQLQILRPAGLGLDERALAAVSQYTFQPAMENGSPVPVELNIEVNFQRF